jgi:hypothetical protein
MPREETVYNDTETTIPDIATRLDLEERERICYLFDYGSEWRFYAILKAILDDDPSDKSPDVPNERGEPAVQYPSPNEDSRHR